MLFENCTEEKQSYASLKKRNLMSTLGLGKGEADTKIAKT
jgi:hypothetical protein